jgi:hypothetical protein
MLPMVELFADQNTYLKPGQRFAIARAQVLERRLQREAGFLVEAAEVRRVLAKATGQLRAELFGSIHQAAADLDLPPATVSRLTTALDDKLRKYIQACRPVAPGLDLVAPGFDLDDEPSLEEHAPPVGQGEAAVARVAPAGRLAPPESGASPHSRNSIAA